jgi:hypothetical protein
VAAISVAVNVAALAVDCGRANQVTTVEFEETIAATTFPALPTESTVTTQLTEEGDAEEVKGSPVIVKSPVPVPLVKDTTPHALTVLPILVYLPALPPPLELVPGVVKTPAGVKVPSS